MSMKIIFLLFFSIFKIKALTTTQIEIIKSVSDQLLRRQILIVKNLSEKNEIYKMIDSVKYFSNFGIYTSFRSVSNIKPSLLELLPSEITDYYKYHPRTMAIIDENDLSKMAKLYFNDKYDLVTPKLVWLTFGKSKEILIKKMNGSYVLHDSQFLLSYPMNENTYEIFEIYNLNYLVSDFNVSHFGQWNRTKGLNVPIPDFNARRFNLNGVTIGQVTNCQLLKETLNCPNRNQIYFDYIIQEFGRMMNFRMEYISTHKNNNSMEKFRKDYPYSFMEFFNNGIYILDSPDVVPIKKIQHYLHVSYIKKYEEAESSPFTRPYFLNLWMATLSWILISTIILILIDQTVNRMIKPSRNFTLLDAFFASFEAFTYQSGSGTCPEAASTRFAYFLIPIPSIFLVLAYSSIMLSFLTVRNIHLPFQNLEEFVQDGSFRISYDKNTYIKIWFQNTNDPVSKTAYEKFFLKEKNLPVNLYEGIGKMCNDSKLSYISYDDQLFEYSYSCQPLQIPSPLFATTMVIVLRLGSPYKNIFSRMFNSIRSSGAVHAMNNRNNYFNVKNGRLLKNTKYYLRNKRFEVDTVGWHSVKSIFVLLGIIYVITINILLLECYIYGKSNKKK